MSLTAWLDLIRQRFSSDEGQVLVRGLQQDPLVWQFIQDEEISLPYFKNAPNDFSAYTPGKMAAWLIEQNTGHTLTDIGESNFTLPADLKARAAQALETTFNTGLPPADLMTAGLLALILQERRIRKGMWNGLSEEIFVHRNPQAILKNYRIWQTPFACLFEYCSDVEELSADFTTSSSENIRKTYIPIFLHMLITNPMEPGQLMEYLLSVLKNLTIDDQLESLRWLRDFRQDLLQVNLAKYLLQTKDNTDFVAQVFSQLEAFDAVNPDIDPLEKPLPYTLPEDVNRLAAFHYFSGNTRTAVETYQRSNDLLKFLKAQTLFQALIGETGHIASSRWLEIIKSVPHSKQARLFYARALVSEHKFEEARQQLEELPQTIQQQLLLNQTKGDAQEPFNVVLTSNKSDKKTDEKFKPQASYFIHQLQMGKHAEILQAISQDENPQECLPWLEKYLQSNINDIQAVKLTQELYEKTHQIENAIELTAYLERSEPTDISHKRKLARLYAQAERWQDAFIFLQTLVKSENKPEIEELEMFAEAAIRTNQVDMGMSICQNILKRSPDNPKALVLLGEVYLHKGDVVKAIQHMESVVELIPNEPEAWLTLSWLWAENDQSDRALETLKKGININPDRPQLLRALGTAHVEKQELPEALSAFKQAYELDPDHIQGKLDLASVYHQAGQPEKALPLLEAFTKNYEQHPQAARLLGHTLLALDQHVSAEPVLLFAAQQFPEDLNTVRSAVQLVLDRVESDPEINPESILQDAGAILAQASKIHQDLGDIKRQSADIDRLNGQHQKAFDIYSHLAQATDHQKSTGDWHLKYGLGQAAIGLGNQEVGLAALQDALNIQPSSLIVRHALADALQIADLPGRANEMAKSALRMAPQDLNNILWYAKFKTKTNDPDEAVRALKEAINLIPQRDELKLWLAKSLISAGSVEEAQGTIADFIASAPPNPDLLHQAGYVSIQLNDLDLAAQAMEKALQYRAEINPILLMDLAIIYALMDNHKKALDILDIEPKQIAECPQIALLKGDLLSNIGQYESAYTALKSINDVVEYALCADTLNSSKFHGSPLLYAHDLSLDGYHLRLGQISRALGKFDEAKQHLATVLERNPQDIKLRNAFTEMAVVGLNLQPALEYEKLANQPNPTEPTVSQDWLDLICSQAEILIYQDNNEQAATLINHLAHGGGAYPRFLALQSRLSAKLGKTEIAKEHLNNAITSFNETLGSLQSQAPLAIFRKIINLHNIAEASLDLGNYLEAIQTWEKIHSQLDTQPLFNWRYLYALVTGAEAQQIANSLAIKAHCPGEICLSEGHHKMAEHLLTKLQDWLPQDQIICLKARIESAYTGVWPTHLNVDACLQGPEDAAAVLIGSGDDNLVRDIIESYPDDLQVLQAYGIYALRHRKSDAIPCVENALRLDTANPINHALLAYLNVNQPAHALNSIETALSFWPDEPEWHIFAADLNTELGNSDMAQRHIQFALDNQPENAKYWQKSALLKIQNNDFAQAKTDLETSNAFQSDDPATWAAMAEINRHMGDVSDALDNIRIASQLDPNDKNLVMVEMQLLYDQQNYADLEEKAKSILAENSTDETTQIYLAQALAKQGKFEQALNTLNQSLNVKPNNSRIALEYHKIKKDQQGVEKVLPELISLAQNHPQDPAVLTTLTDWLIQANRIDEAEKVAQTTLRIVPDQAEVHLMLGRLQRIKGKLDQAITHLSQAITLDTALIEAYIELGKTYQERRDMDKAIEIFKKGSLANRTDPRPYYYSGLALKDIKDYPGAELMLKQAKRYSPDDANIIRQLGVVTALNLVNNLREAK